MLRVLASETDGILTLKDMDAAADYPAGETFKRRFGSWNAAKEAAGLDTVPEDEVRPRYSDEELLEMLQELAEQHDRPITEHDVKEADDLPALFTFEHRFGSWNSAKEEAGLATRGRGEAGRGPSYSDEELLEQLRELSRQHDGPVTRAVMNDADGYPGTTTYERRFGSWRRAKEKALEKIDSKKGV